MKGRFFLFPAILLSGSVLYCVYAIWFYFRFGGFPPPIFYDAADSFGDYFNTLFWSSREGRFDEWKSIYPMFCFLLGKILVSSECQEKSATALMLRDCNLSAIWFLLVAYVFGAAFAASSIIRQFSDGVVLAWKKWFAGFLLWFFVVLLSISGLYAVERGNFIVFAFLFLSISVFTKNDIFSALFLALAISVKQYLLVLLFVPFLRRNFRFIVVVLSVLLFLNSLSLLLIPDSHHDMLLANMLGFSGEGVTSFFEKIWNPSSINAWLRALEYSPYADNFITVEQKYFALYLGTIILWGLRLLFIASMCVLLVRRGKDYSDAYISFLILVGISVATDSLGGYALLLLFPFLGAAIKRADGVLLLIGLLFLFFPLEIPLWPGLSLEGSVSYLSGIELHGFSRVTFGAYVRPLMLLGVMVLMAWEVVSVNKNLLGNNDRLCAN